MYGELKAKILELRGQGHTYGYISDTLDCSKGTVCFHCGQGQKEKSRARLKKRRSDPLIRKIEQFCCGRKKVVNEWLNKTQEVIEKELILKMRGKVARFFKSQDGQTYGEFMFSAKELLEKIGKNPTCYLTGKPIDLDKSRSYHLDHIVPKSRGGSDSLDNCQIACREANQAKGDLLVEEFVALCKSVISHTKK